MFRQRTITALVLAPLAICAILFLPHGLFALLTAAAFLVALWEWTRLLGYARTTLRLGLVGVQALLLAALWFAREAPLWWIAIVAGVAWWLLAMWWLRHFSFAAAPTRENGWLKLGAGCLVVLPAWAALMELHGSDARGPAWTLFGLILVWVADSGAYLAGSRWGAGTKKLAPRISPGKTWVGVYGAIAASALAAVIGAWVLDARGAVLLGVVVLAMLTVAFSIVGDLFESLIKRHANAKDSGDLFPGHGGMFDRLDSVFAALPVWACGLALLGL
ncbi:MAG TPA: phosphatidate cytidylyltransferase [Rhodanobacteraceae bacterium]|nr:phosphatidate cytidylyltransferase [Rhodanobacteraceae bacterium]